DNAKLLTTRDPLGHLTSFTHNSRGLPTSMTDALGSSTYYQYDAFVNLSREVYALGNATTFTSHPNGQLLSQTVSRTTSSGQESLTTSFDYDKSGRLLW